MIYVLVSTIILLLLIKFFSKPSKLLKNRLHYKIVFLKGGSFSRKPQNLTFKNLPFKDRALLDHVLKCINYHSPITYSKINVSLLKNSGINLNIPVYIENQPNKKLFKKLENINKKLNFNLIIFEKTNKLNWYTKYLKRNKNLKVLCYSDISKELKENLYKININYISPKLQEKALNDGFNFYNFKLKEHFEDINLLQNYFNDKFNIKVIKNKFYATANYLEIKNISTKTEVLRFNFVKNFNEDKLSYYLFEKNGRCIKAINLLSGEEQFFYTSILPTDVTYSSVDGIKNSNKPCLKMSFCLSLKAGEERRVLLTESNESLKDYLGLFEENQIELKKLFNTKIQTGNRALDTLFNFTLPRSITLSGVQKFQGGDYSLEEILKRYKEDKISSFECYKLLKQKFVVENKDIFELQPNAMNYKLKIFLENKVKTISAIKGEKTCLNIDDVLYYNARTISKSALSKAKKEIKIVF